MRYFVLLIKKGTKKIIGAIPARKGATPSQIKKQIKRDKLSKYVRVKIIPQQTFVKIKARLRIKRLKRKTVRKRRTSKRKR